MSTIVHEVTSADVFSVNEAGTPTGVNYTVITDTSVTPIGNLSAANASFILGGEACGAAFELERCISVSIHVFISGTHAVPPTANDVYTGWHGNSLDLLDLVPGLAAPTYTYVRTYSQALCEKVVTPVHPDANRLYHFCMTLCGDGPSAQIKVACLARMAATAAVTNSQRIVYVLVASSLLSSPDNHVKLMAWRDITQI